MIKNLINFIVEKRIDSITKKKYNILKTSIFPADYSDSINQEYLRLWKPLHKRPFQKVPFYYGSINQNLKASYVSENIYYGKIEPVLNNKAYALTYSDKNFYENYFTEYQNLFPEAVLRGINGRIYSKDYTLADTSRLLKYLEGITGDLILKPATETGGGSNVIKLVFEDNVHKLEGKILNNEALVGLLTKKYSGNFILQSKIIQNNWFADFNTTSLNTVRLYTYRSVLTEKVIPVNAVLRFGKPGSIVDNQAAGGLSCGISEEGKLNGFAIDKYGNKYSDLPFILAKKGEYVDSFTEMKNVAAKLAPKYFYHRLLGFDFCVDSHNKVRLLEINCKNIEVNFLQLNNGPLFGDYTNEIIEFCLSNKKSIVLDFYV